MTRVLFAMVLALTALPSQAAVILYTDETAYLAAVGATRTHVNFAGSPGATVSGASFTPDVSFGSCTDSGDPGSCGTSVLHGSDAITDLGGSAADNGVASLAWRFNLPDVFAFGFNYISGGIGNDRYFIDDFRISGIGPVAEPASLALLGVALTAVGFRMRRRRTT